MQTCEQSYNSLLNVSNHNNIILSNKNESDNNTNENLMVKQLIIGYFNNNVEIIEATVELKNNQ